MFSIVFLITAIFTFEGMDQAYFTYHTDMAFLSEELCDNHISKKGEEVIVSLEEHYLGEENNFPPSVNKDDYVAKLETVLEDFYKMFELEYGEPK